MSHKDVAPEYTEPGRRLDPVVYKLRKRRYEVNISLSVLAAKMGYHQATVAGWECGARKPSYRSMRDWCDALGVELSIEVK